MPTCCIVVVAAFLSLGVGLALMLYGRNRLLRSVGVLLSAALGPAIAWVSGRFLFRSVGERLIGHEPSAGDVYILGQDITLAELLWIPLQDAGFYILTVVVIVAVYWIYSGFRQRTVTPAVASLEDHLADMSLDRILDGGRQNSKAGWLVYRAVAVITIVFALPVMGLIAYATLQILSLSGEVFLIADWINWSVFGACVLFGVLYLFVNGAVALRV